MNRDFQVGKWHVSAGQGVIAAGEKSSQLEPRVMDLLVYLAEHSDEVLSKNRLIQAVWPDTFVADDVLTSAIWKLRQALGDDPRNPVYIRTLPRRGYQLVAEVLFPEENTVQNPDRYRLDRKLGEGGMGEVYLALDTELGRPVALKFLREGVENNETRQRRLRHEARAAARLDHPFICRVYDTGIFDGRHFISMEYIEGEKLSHQLRKGPLPIGEAVRIALEMTEALEVAHRHGIVHRDIKTSNVILTDQCHVKITDFGIAKRLKTEESQTEPWTETRTADGTSGTPAYMSPEQIRLEPVDHRTDLFLLGIVLYEMLTGVHPFRKATPEGTTAAILEATPTPVSEVLDDDSLRFLDATVSKLLAKSPEERYQLAHHLRRRLKAIIGRVSQRDAADTRRSGSLAEAVETSVDRATTEEIRPYPGLAPFTVSQADYFFGRELEIEAIWRKIRQSHFLGLIGPSGGGKSSFLHAGVVPAAPEDWGIVIATPGKRPLLGLAQALSAEFAGDPETVRQLIRFEEPEVARQTISGWRSRYREVLIIVDQFEEIFTLNSERTRESFAEFLGQLVEEAGAHLLLAMRDDFLFRCHGLPSLERIFDADLTPMGPPTGSALRRALVQPAAACGYQFEDEALVEEMLESVKGERGALPLLAFAVAQLWERRDRQKRLLLQKAYEVIGGVEGALAAHAEATLEKIGSERVPIVRELFRNLVSAEGTRSVQIRRELLSLFSFDRQEEAEQVLDLLVEARLLVVYQKPSAAPEDEHEQAHLVEIVHESLLNNWPRLVLWQAREAEGARLRDELRQAARTWDQHGRSEDLLWTGIAFREYEIWKEQYPGGLTELEREFGHASARNAKRRGRRRRLAVMVVLAVAALVSLTTSLLWRQSAAEARRAEAAHLLALAQLDPESNPTAAIAYATKSLELADTETARRFVARILSQGPIAFVLEEGVEPWAFFSPDGQSLVASRDENSREIWRSGGSLPVSLSEEQGDYVPPNQLSRLGFSFSPDNRFLFASAEDGGPVRYSVWDFPDLRMVNTFTLDSTTTQWIHPRGIVAFSKIDGRPMARARLFPFDEDKGIEIGTWPWPDCARVLLGELGIYLNGAPIFHFGPESTQMVNIVGKDLYVVTGLPDEPSAPRKFGELEDPGYLQVDFIAGGTRFATCDNSRINIWGLDPQDPSPLRTFESPQYFLNFWDFDDRGTWLAVPKGEDHAASVWDLTAPVCRGPQVLRFGGSSVTTSVSVHPDGRWVAVGDGASLTLWPLRHSYPFVLFRHGRLLSGLDFDPEGKWFAAASFDGRLRVWSMETTGDSRFKVLHDFNCWLVGVRVSPDGERIATSNWHTGHIFVIPASGGPVQELAGFSSTVNTLSFDQTGKRLAAVGGFRLAEDSTIRIWNLETGQEQVLISSDPTICWLRFDGEDRLYTSGREGLRHWNLEDGSSELMVADVTGLLSPDGRYFLAMKEEGFPERRGRELAVHDLEQGTRWALPSHGEQIAVLAWHPSGKAVLSSNADGIIRVSDLQGKHTHLLMGHEGVSGIRVDPSGDWIASVGMDMTIRLWPMPDVSKPPSHTLPHRELLAKLKSLTNYRVGQDESSPTGYRTEVGPFPGWKSVPQW